MRKILTTIVFASLFLFINTAEAQTVFVIQNGSKVKFLEKASDVTANLENGDTLYLPAKPVPGTSGNNWSFDKQVHIIGAGYHLDSAKTTGITKMLGDLSFNKGSIGSSITGVRIEGNVYLKDSVITVSRCNMTSMNIQNGSEPISQITISDCHIGSLNGGNDVVTNCLVERCVVHGNIGSGNKTHQMLIKNCILLHTSRYAYEGLHNLSIVNSIILHNNDYIFYNYNYGYNCTGITLNNNLWVRASLHYNSSFILNDNVWSVLAEDIFEDFENGDYRIKSTCTQALTLADDGGQVGIYGTDEPFLVPTLAPRIISIDNAKKVSDGKLSVKMEVEARDR